jgi:anti-sigma regulatory factor (Ser/Thr protein kinase)
MGTIETDPGKLKTVVRNLLHNAFKFTERGHVTLGAGIDETGAIVITVSDTGRGIPRDALDYVFELFRQVPGAGGGGVGLGLHLVRRLVQALGGTITVESTVGTGTCFRITLAARAPRADDQRERAAGPSPAVDLAAARSARQARTAIRFDARARRRGFVSRRPPWVDGPTARAVPGAGASSSAAGRRLLRDAATVPAVRARPARQVARAAPSRRRATRFRSWSWLPSARRSGSGTISSMRGNISFSSSRTW